MQIARVAGKFYSAAVLWDMVRVTVIIFIQMPISLCTSSAVTYEESDVSDRTSFVRKGTVKK